MIWRPDERVFERKLERPGWSSLELRGSTDLWGQLLISPCSLRFVSFRSGSSSSLLKFGVLKFARPVSKLRAANQVGWV